MYEKTDFKAYRGIHSVKKDHPASRYDRENHQTMSDVCSHECMQNSAWQSSYEEYSLDNLIDGMAFHHIPRFFTSVNEAVFDERFEKPFFENRLNSVSYVQ